MLVNLYLDSGPWSFQVSNFTSQHMYDPTSHVRFGRHTDALLTEVWYTCVALCIICYSVRACARACVCVCVCVCV